MIYALIISFIVLGAGVVEGARPQNAHHVQRIESLLEHESLEQRGIKIAAMYIAACRDNNIQVVQEIHAYLANKSLNDRTLNRMLDYFIEHNPVALSQLTIMVYQSHPKPQGREIAKVIQIRLESLNNVPQQRPTQMHYESSLPQAPGGVPASTLSAHDRRILQQAIANKDGDTLAHFYCNRVHLHFTTAQKAEVHRLMKALDSASAIGAMVNCFKRRKELYALQELSEAVYRETPYADLINKVIQHVFNETNSPQVTLAPRSEPSSGNSVAAAAVVGALGFVAWRLWGKNS